MKPLKVSMKQIAISCISVIGFWLLATIVARVLAYRERKYLRGLAERQARMHRKSQPVDVLKKYEKEFLTE